MSKTMRILLTASAIVGVLMAAPLIAQGYTAESLKADIESHSAALTAAENGDEARLAARELTRSRQWLEQADTSFKRRNVGLGRMQIRNAQMDLQLAQSIVAVDQLTQQRKRLQGEVEALERTVQAARLEEEQ